MLKKPWPMQDGPSNDDCELSQPGERQGGTSLCSWDGQAVSRFEHVYQIEVEEDIVRALEDASLKEWKIRPIGGLHSYSGISSGHMPNQRLQVKTAAIDLSKYKNIRKCSAPGVERSDELYVEAEVGISLRNLNVSLEKAGLALATTSAFGEETLGAALSSGTHGSGSSVGNLSSLMVGARLVAPPALPDGEAILFRIFGDEWKNKGDIMDRWHIESKPVDDARCCLDSFGIGLGVLGVLSTVTLKCVPLYSLFKEVSCRTREDVLSGNGKQWWMAASRRITLFFTPRNDEVTVMCRYLMGQEDAKSVDAGGGHIIHLSDEVKRLTTAWNPRDENGETLSEPSNPCHDLWYRAMSLPPGTFDRQVQTESEFFVPTQCYGYVLSDLMEIMDSEEVVKEGEEGRVSIIVRFIDCDDCALSPANQFSCGPSASRDDDPNPLELISVKCWAAITLVVRGLPQDQHDKKEHADLFDRISEVFEEAMRIFSGGIARPHWGKRHRTHGKALTNLYPRFPEFCELRAELDPQGMLLSPYHSWLLGIEWSAGLKCSANSRTISIANVLA